MSRRVQAQHARRRPYAPASRRAEEAAFGLGIGFLVSIPFLIMIASAVR